MNTPFSWIKDYVPELLIDAQEYADRMTLSGTKVESLKFLDRNLELIVVARILDVRPHPDASRLVVCTVDVGDVRADGVDENGHVQIVTGAPNITGESVGCLVPVVLDGGRVAGGHDGGPLPEEGIEIHTGKLRGVVSYGMMCSVEELGSDRNAYPLAPENGIYIFPDALIEELSLIPGDDALHAFGMDDVSIEYEITSNRVDCMSVIGIAREAAAVFDSPFIMPPIEESGNDEDIHDYLSVRVENSELCPRYTARMVKNIHYAPSPEWMQKRLRNSGIRPINNLVDITNFVMLEYGQPMHAFDYDTLAGHEIIVKCAQKGDVFETLDSQERMLDDTVLMINDAEKAVGIAGIMGGQNSKITENVHTVVFESATFNGTNIRFSSKKIGLRTDASSFYEKGLDPAQAIAANNRACELVEELGCGEVVGGVIDIYPVPEEPVRIKFEPEKINSLLGTDISADEMMSILTRLELRYDEESSEFIVPSFRRDLFLSCDLAEEVLRFHGYDRIDDTLPVGESTVGKVSLKGRADEIIRRSVEYAGFSQIMTYAFESPRIFDQLSIPEDDPLRRAIVIANPLGEDYSIMRTQSIGAMLSSLVYNYNHKNDDVWLYELANVYIPGELPLTELPDEREVLTLGAYGSGADFYTVKGVIEDVLRHLGMRKPVLYESNANRPYLHPGRCADMSYEGTFIGYLGEIHPRTAEAFGFRPGVRIYVALLDVPHLLDFVSFERTHRSVIRYPLVTRDLSMLVPVTVKAGEIDQMIRQRGGKLLENLELFDIYEGDQVAAGFKSMAYSLSLRASDHTLTEDEIVKAMKKILNGLSSMGIELRS